MTYPKVSFVRKEVSKLFPLYRLIRDCISGSTAVKDAGTKYLPMPDASDCSPENKERYAAYLLRAVFYNVTRRTLQGLIGQVFAKDPTFKIPTLMEPIIRNATGGGVSLNQLAKKSLGLTLAYSRSGIFVDYPDVDGGASIEELSSGKIRPTISVYSPLEIINWRVIEVGAEERLSLVVLAESFCYADDGFERKEAPQYRVLYLDENLEYNIDIYREANQMFSDYKEDATNKEKNFEIYESYKPRGADGMPIREIPFMFVGSENNDANPDNPNFYDLADLNIAHYRNSADYEESCFLVGQPTPVVTGLTEQWLNEVLDGKINFGSRGGIPLPANASATLLQATENTMIKEAMDTKERQMVAIGAKLVEQKQVQRTAFETKVETTGETSILSATTHNVNEALLWALQKCAELMNIPNVNIEYSLNTDFDISKATPEERTQIISAWQQGAISWTEMRLGLRRGGIATEDDAKVKQEVLEDKRDSLALANSFNNDNNQEQ